MRYKTTSWEKEIDPAFNRFIRVYIAAFRRMQLPGNEGYLALDLDDQEYKKVELEGFPSIASLYEHDKLEDIMSDAELMYDYKLDKDVLKMVKREAKKKGGIFRIFISSAEHLEKESKDYYLKAFTPFTSDKNREEVSVPLNENEKLRLRKRIYSDIFSFIWHTSTIDIENLVKDSQKHMKMLKRSFTRTRLIKRSLFFAWNTISLLVNKKSLQELFTEAKRNDESLFKLIKVDKTLFDHDWVRERIRKAMYSGDGKFFIALAQAIREDPLLTRFSNLEIAVVLLQFWKVGIYRLTIPQRMKLLTDGGIHFKQDEVLFRKINDRIRPFANVW